MKCKVVLNCQGGDYEHRVEDVPEEDFMIIKNFLNSLNNYNSSSEVGYSRSLRGESIGDKEWKQLSENAELLGIEFIVEGA